MLKSFSPIYIIDEDLKRRVNDVEIENPIPKTSWKNTINICGKIM
ncbi:MAG: hypothetical protein QXY40_04615 [Candidatus Methanomethylicia archaeon]